MTLDRSTLPLLDEALAVLEEGFARLPPTATDLDRPALRRVVLEAARRMQDNFPYHHPLYMGQMLKPPHPAARLAYALSMWINPNNHALDGGRASSAMEKEAVAEIAGMVGWETHLGHLCGGGTMANLEALWVARELAPGRAMLASDQAHYTHRRLCGVLSVPFRTVATDALGRMDPGRLERELARGDVGTVVVTLGTTALGAVDPLHEVLPLCRARGVRVHVDAAYGGFFALASNLDEDARQAFDATRDADSYVVDPHKHGLQPYGCGCVLFRDPESVGPVYRHDSPYTYFTSDELHLGEISLECSRPGAAAVALWTTSRLLPYERGGRFARSLDACRQGALALHARLATDARFRPLLDPQLDIVVWAVQASSPEESSRRARAVFEAAAERDLHLALAAVPAGIVGGEAPVTCLRACVMKPDHQAWLETILARLDAAARAAGLGT